MKGAQKGNNDIIGIIGDVVKRTASECTLTITAPDGSEEKVECPEINYVFGNNRYVKDNLDALSRSVAGTERKFPLIALFCPFSEKRGSADFQSKAKIQLLIACSSCREWSNEQRRLTSFVNILRPIYDSFMKELGEDHRLRFSYRKAIPHEYSENYSYGRYGAYTSTGEEVSEVIDAINIFNLEIEVKTPKCR